MLREIAMYFGAAGRRCIASFEAICGHNLSDSHKRQLALHIPPVIYNDLDSTRRVLPGCGLKCPRSAILPLLNHRKASGGEKEKFRAFRSSVGAPAPSRNAVQFSFLKPQRWCVTGTSGERKSVDTDVGQWPIYEPSSIVEKG